MGQRLVVSVEHLGQCLAKLYYHWSAYTTSALYETKKIVDCIYNHDDETEKQLQLRLIRFCQENGGGVRGDDAEFDYIQKQFPNEILKKDGYSRNNGLIAISEQGMDDLQSWSEGDVTIDIDEDVIYFGIYASYESLEEYNEERKEWDDEDFEELALEEIPDIGYDLGTISVEDIGYVISALDAVNSNPVRNGNEIIELTE